MAYKENPKTNGSGIICCIPQKGKCPMNCPDCFYQSGRSYLSPFEENLPNIPTVKTAKNRIVRMNDGNDSNIDRDLVIECAKKFKYKFYNTSMPKELERFDAPIVLTVNPGKTTDNKAIFLYRIPVNLMFVRVRVNAWNLSLVDAVVDYYTSRKVPVVLTFMAYFFVPIPILYRHHYIYRKRTLNKYYAIRTKSWRKIMKRYENNIFVYSCGKLEGEKGNTACKYCGNCIREFFATLERMRNNEKKVGFNG